MPDLFVYGATLTSPALRHEVPVAIGDPFALLITRDRTTVVSNVLERDRIARALPDVEVVLEQELGWDELSERGMPVDEMEIEVAVRAVLRAGVRSVVVPPELPIAVGDALRARAIEVTVDAAAFAARRRVKSAFELAGIRRAQRAAEAGMAEAAAMLRAAQVEGTGLRLDGEVLTAERIRAAIRHACADAGAPAPADVMVVSAWSGGGHDPGSGPLPAHLPIEIDLWPCDDETGCWADMTRTFVVGEVTAEVAAVRETVLAALEAGRAAIRPGVTGRSVYDAACDVVEAAGIPTQRTRAPDTVLDHGFYFGLGHGIGLEVHEAPSLGLLGREELVAGDVVAIEPGVEGMPYGGLRFEDLVLVTDTGGETLTAYPYDLQP